MLIADILDADSNTRGQNAFREQTVLCIDEGMILTPVIKAEAAGPDFQVGRDIRVDYADTAAFEVIVPGGDLSFLKNVGAGVIDQSGGSVDLGSGASSCGNKEKETYRTHQCLFHVVLLNVLRAASSRHE